MFCSWVLFGNTGSTDPLQIRRFILLIQSINVYLHLSRSLFCRLTVLGCSSASLICCSLFNFSILVLNAYNSPFTAILLSVLVISSTSHLWSFFPLLKTLLSLSSPHRASNSHLIWNGIVGDAMGLIHRNFKLSRRYTAVCNSKVWIETCC